MRKFEIMKNKINESIILVGQLGSQEITIGEGIEKKYRLCLDDIFIIEFDNENEIREYIDNIKFTTYNVNE